MLRRLKTVSPKYKTIAGIWIAIELLSIPAAATVIAAGWTIQPDIIAEQVNQDQPGTAIYIVTHTTAFDVAVQGTVGQVTVDVQGTTDPLGRALRTSHCAQIDTSHIQIVDHVDGPAEDYATTIVTVTYDADTKPEISLVSKVLAPAAPGCTEGAA
jgi:hypothetical protein